MDASHALAAIPIPASTPPAIQAVDNGQGRDTIALNITGEGVQTIQPLSAFPIITQSVTIDGTTQPDYAGTPLIELAGSPPATAALTTLVTASRTSAAGHQLTTLHPENHNQTQAL